MQINYQGEVNLGESTAKGYSTDTNCTILVSVDDGRCHLSISNDNRYPSEEEVNQVREEILPEDKEFKKSKSKKFSGYYIHLWEKEKQH